MKSVPGGSGAFGRGASWAVMDQAVSSLTNFGLSYLVLRWYGLADFGVFTIAYISYSLALAFNRAVVCQPMVIRYSGVGRDEWRREAARATGAGALVGLCLGAVAAAVSILVRPGLGSVLLALGAVLPALLFQDTWRFVLFAGAAPARALVIDSVWGVTQLTVIAWLVLRGDPPVATLVFVWGASAGVAGLVAAVQAGAPPSLGSARRWFRDHRDLASHLALEVVLGRSARQVALVLVGAIAGLEALGALQGARTLFGPLNVLFLGVVPIGIAEGVRLSGAEPLRFRRAIRSLGAGLAACGLAVGTALLVAPDDWLRQVVPDKWDEIEPLILLVALAMAARAVVIAARVGLRALARVRASLIAQIWVSGFLLTVVPAGALMGGAFGTAVGLALAAAFGAFIYGVAFERSHPQRTASDLPTSDTGPLAQR